MATNHTLAARRSAFTDTHPDGHWFGLAKYLRWLDPSLRRRIATGATWSVAGAGFASGLAMAANVVCARLLGATHFGELAIVLSTTNLVSGVATILFVTAGAAVAGVSGALLGHVVVGAITSVYYQIVVRRECASKQIAISYRFGREDVRILWRFTLPVLLTTLSFTPA